MACDVDSGLWYDPYSDESFAAAAALQIEHVIPLAEAHRSGSWAWTQERRRLFSNFLDSAYHLIPIKGAVNSSKQESDPAKWLPPNLGYHRSYAGNRARIKAHWGLKADAFQADGRSLYLPLTGIVPTFRATR